MDKVNKNKSLEALMTRQEVADYFKVSLPTLWSWTKQGRIKSVGIGRRVYYKQSDIEQAIIDL